MSMWRWSIGSPGLRSGPSRLKRRGEYIFSILGIVLFHVIDAPDETPSEGHGVRGVVGSRRRSLLHLTEPPPEGLVHGLLQGQIALLPYAPKKGGDVVVQCECGSHTSEHHDNDVLMSRVAQPPFICNGSRNPRIQLSDPTAALADSTLNRTTVWTSYWSRMVPRTDSCVNTGWG